jgi:hypothetical protein
MTWSFIRLVALAAMATWLHGAHAQTQPTYAILSLLGDRIWIVTHQPGTGSRLDKNRRQEVVMPDDSLDGIAAFAADDALKQAQPGATTRLFTTRDANLIALQDKSLDGEELPAELLEGVKTLVAKANAQRLIVLTRFRDETRIRFNDGYVGSGRVAGVGFFIDPWQEVLHRDTGQVAEGFLGPYAYVRVNMYDLPSLKPVAAVRVKASSVATMAKSKTAVTAWQSMTGPEKFDALKGVIREAVTEAIPKVVR